MSYQPLPVGVDNFEKLITRGYYYVDKTMFIKELLDKKGDVSLFTRPRRFGKTLNISMLQYFFEDARDYTGEKIDNSSLFEGLGIMGCGSMYLDHMGKYPVISLSLKSAKQEDFEQSFAALADDIAEEFRRHEYLLKSECMDTFMKERYREIMSWKAGRTEYNKSLKFLSECLYRYYGRKVIILIDEYDVPLESAHTNGYYSQMVNFIRSLFESALKTNPYLEFAVMTGCLRVSKESIFTGMNNLEIISILNSNYDEYFGLTESEVRQMCENYGLTAQFARIKAWYDGYIFGEEHVYNPWSMICYIKDLLANSREYPASYWANTSSNSIVRELIRRADGDVKAEIEGLIGGKTIEKPIYEDITYSEIYESKDHLWNFMFFTGYFRKAGERFEESSGQRYLSLAIPNEEIRYIFRNQVLNWFHEQVKERDRSRLFGAIVSMDGDIVKEEIEMMLKKTISFQDAYESFYHGFLAGILYGMEDYIVKSNREGGRGRTDLFIKPVSRRKTAFVIEFKIAGSVKSLAAKAREALRQIAEKEYERELLDDGYDSIAWYGVAFCGKDCEVEIKGV